MIDGTVTYEPNPAEVFKVSAAHLDYVAERNLPASPHDLRQRIAPYTGKEAADAYPPTVMGLMVILAYYTPSPYSRSDEYYLQRARTSPISAAIDREIRNQSGG